ncbi:hypothetical protein ACVGWN_26190, partial [Enterobacter hormaechei]
RELYDGMMQKWQAVYADQLGLVDSGLTTSMWEAPGLVRASPTPRPSPKSIGLLNNHYQWVMVLVTGVSYKHITPHQTVHKISYSAFWV